MVLLASFDGVEGLLAHVSDLASLVSQHLLLKRGFGVLGFWGFGVLGFWPLFIICALIRGSTKPPDRWFD